MLFRSETSLLQKRGYVLGADLGEGSYAKVKSATWLKPGSDKPIKVALKIISGPDIPQDFKEKFLPRELDIVPSLNHENIIKTMEVFNGGKKTYLTLEYAGRGDLLSYVQLRGALKESESSTLFKQLVAGIVYLHSNGIVHRDLKCENVLLNNQNLVKIADFGFARKMTRNDMSNTYCGSASYASPEILQGIPYRGDVVDNWSLGVILFVMNCGIMPFRDTNIRVLMMDQQLPLRYNVKLDGTLTPSAKELMQGILSYDLQQRYNLPKMQRHEWLRNVITYKQSGKTTVKSSSPRPLPDPSESTSSGTNNKTDSEAVKMINCSPEAQAALRELVSEGNA